MKHSNSTTSANSSYDFEDSEDESPSLDRFTTCLNCSIDLKKNLSFNARFLEFLETIDLMIQSQEQGLNDDNDEVIGQAKISNISLLYGLEEEDLLMSLKDRKITPFNKEMYLEISRRVHENLKSSKIGWDTQSKLRL